MQIPLPYMARVERTWAWAQEMAVSDSVSQSGGTFFLPLKLCSASQTSGFHTNASFHKAAQNSCGEEGRLVPSSVGATLPLSV